MKKDLDALMSERKFDAIVVIGEATGNHALKYITNDARVTHAIVVKKRGEQPVLIVNGMERDEAASSGLLIHLDSEFDLYKHMKEAETAFEARLRYYISIFEKLGVRGTVSFYGIGDPGQQYVTLKTLDERLPDVTITGEPETTIFDSAYITKDEVELAKIRSVAERTNIVMAEAIEFIKSHQVEGDQVLNTDGRPLTIGEVKRFVRARLLHHHLEEGGDMIFAIGRDAGVPHSRGEDDAPVLLGKSIVFDLFPRELGGGYFHDMTRTFCLGYAPPEIQQAYDQVMQAFTEVVSTLQVDEQTGKYQNLACDIFEEHGHKTSRSDPGTLEGYVHSLGHGLGLQIHSRPSFRDNSKDLIQVGQVFTIEPGLYYPDKGYGVRIEDTLLVDQDGKFQSLTPFPKDLIIPMS